MTKSLPDTALPRVLRPGGVGLTRWMLDALAVGPADRVVELAAGLGATARLTLVRAPAGYTAVDRDPAAVAALSTFTATAATNVRAVWADASATGLPPGSATVVYGEAMLTPRPEPDRRLVIREARRLLDGTTGRYGIHELCLLPDGPDCARPLTPAHWSGLLAEEGFTVTARRTAPMRGVFRRHRAHLAAVSLIAVPTP
ncbi:class I SAM-dependent methyltransferase [Streptomyces sp. NPDC057877]|uniref:class I SAM-dependent methyltransferase n=1 Tax=Streptomyces sp. NPDC057877 TaxID=3346269 RepID=UPI0036AEBC98